MGVRSDDVAKRLKVADKHGHFCKPDRETERERRERERESSQWGWVLTKGEGRFRIVSRVTTTHPPL